MSYFVSEGYGMDNKETLGWFPVRGFVWRPRMTQRKNKCLLVAVLSHRDQVETRRWIIHRRNGDEPWRRTSASEFKNDIVRKQRISWCRSETKVLFLLHLHNIRDEAETPQRAKLLLLTYEHKNAWGRVEERTHATVQTKHFFICMKIFGGFVSLTHTHIYIHTIMIVNSSIA